MQWKHSLHALAVRDPAHGESFIQPAALTTDHNARKDLDSFLVAFYHSCMYTHAVANRKRRDLAFLLLFLNDINDLVHKLVASARGCGRTLSFEENAFATRNRGAFEQKRKHEDMQKICENLANLWLIPSPSAPVAQLDRALASGAKGCGFDPRRAHSAWLQCTFAEYLSIFSGFESFPCPNGFAPYRSFLREKPVAFGHLAVPDAPDLG